MEKQPLEHLLRDEKAKGYLTTFRPGQVLCREGDYSQDLCVLISGKLEVFRGDRKVEEISEPGAVLGQISFVLGTHRTVTVRALEETKVLLIPRKDVHDFLKAYPEIAWEIPRSLAREVDLASHVLAGMKELCDHLPDAFLMTDKQGKLLSWNKAAEDLFGRNWDGMYLKPAEILFEDREAFRDFMDEILSRAPVKERILRIQHPRKGIRYVSASTNVFAGAHRHFQGVLFLCRDVTGTIRMEKKLRRVWLWLIPGGVLALILAAVFFRPSLIPWIAKDRGDTNQMELQSIISRDRFLLAPSLATVIRSGDRKKAGLLLMRFFHAHRDNDLYEGILVLDEGKRVFAVAQKDDSGGTRKVGTSYAAVPFGDIAGSAHCVLGFFRTDAMYPMGRKWVDVAFPLKSEGRRVGCLKGFQAHGGAEAVGTATTSFVVTSIFLIILADSVFAVVRTYWG
ncbi:MAG: cyclic nucleotide-binding domain-containing protein [Deltaproteobacteria bacterium]|nr:cyclic nucleotide-binding domain-containing protein [Deltaproteobacteria bacterium]RLB38686.1 MAG: hypothetical protein DRH20_05215 [Deltaproteobacteria bacterium]